ncbi:NAD-dependent epimerase/dehydratase family protein [Mucilaginibacter sp. OK098]|uniref:NAD-dependent epimerase/dehydratase family protein n=1 Tax=Mucilaginibacter sp. OK098 TaxID=1855297 RepID=UPI0009170473|nr:NAD-dependent epimerase/dehydratase family protein [Mucilaginibacter sp. OK098]SHN13347.1 Nucleoside-diphosphate-sugar epimerase [Mucilaginibacter sp. OK098]
MSLAITGFSGFVGKNLVNYMNELHINVCLFSRNDLQNITIDQNISTILHLAGKAHDLKKTSNPDEYYQVNYELTKKLYDAFLKSNAKNFIFISSVKAVADEVHEILTEDVEPNPQTHYGKSKLIAEQYIQNQPLPAGKEYYILRPCMIHGPGNKGNLNLLFKLVKKGIPYPLAGFNNKRSFLSVENLCFIIKEIVEREDIPGGIYHVSDDEALSTNEVVSILASSLNVKPRLWKIPPSFIRFFAQAGDRFHLPLTTERLNKLTENYVVSNQKIKRTLNKEFPISAVSGLITTANSFNKD